MLREQDEEHAVLQHRVQTGRSDDVAAVGGERDARDEHQAADVPDELQLYADAAARQMPAKPLLGVEFHGVEARRDE